MGWTKNANTSRQGSKVIGLEGRIMNLDNNNSNRKSDDSNSDDCSDVKKKRRSQKLKTGAVSSLGYRVDLCKALLVDRGSRKRLEESKYYKCAFPPDIRQLLRSLNSLKDGPLAAECIYMTVMRSFVYIRNKKNNVATQRFRHIVSSTMKRIQSHTKNFTIYPNKRLEERLAVVIKVAIENAIDFGLAQQQQQASKDSNDDDDDDDDESDSHNNLEGDNRRLDLYSNVREVSFRNRKRKASMEGQDDTNHDNNNNNNSVREQAIRQSTSIFIEALNLRVRSRTSKRWGGERKYEIFQLPYPTKIFPPHSINSCDTMEELANSIQTTFRDVYRSPCEHTGICRAYCYIKEPNNVEKQDKCNEHEERGNTKNYHLCIQMNIGLPFDYYNATMGYMTSGNKRKNPGREFNILLEVGTNLLAVTADMLPSRSRFCRFILGTLEQVLCNSSFGNSKPQTIMSTWKIPSLSGSQPYSLLETAKHWGLGGGSDSTPLHAPSDPLSELHQAAHGTILSRTSQEKERLKLASQHGSHVSNMATYISAASDGSSKLIATSTTGAFGTIVKHNEGNTHTKQKKKIDGPVLERFSWKWTGQTTAISSAISQEYPNFHTKKDRDEIPSTFAVKFKCGIVMEGPDVFGGLQKLMDAGIVNSPLPHYMADAPKLMGSSTITVVNGACGKLMDRSMLPS